MINRKRGFLIIDQSCLPHAEQVIRHEYEVLKCGGGREGFFFFKGAESMNTQ